MIVSMTGYGRHSLKNESFSITVEMKSVNHRFSEISVHLPRSFMRFEEKVKQWVSPYIQRGKTDVFITFEGKGIYERQLNVDWKLVQQYIEALQSAQQQFGLPSHVRADQLLQDAFIVTEKEVGSNQLETLLFQAVKQALDQLSEMRKQEGHFLYDDLNKRLRIIDKSVDTLRKHAPNVVSDYQSRLLKRIEEFLQGSEALNENRLMTEIAIYSDKANFDEELTRLKSHIHQFGKILEDDKAVGRKLNFLLQEMNREMNTIGSKGNDLAISKLVVDVKSELEKIKEQIQNVE